MAETKKTASKAKKPAVKAAPVLDAQPEVVVNPDIVVEEVPPVEEDNKPIDCETVPEEVLESTEEEELPIMDELPEAETTIEISEEQFEAREEIDEVPEGVGVLDAAIVVAEKSSENTSKPDYLRDGYYIVKLNKFLSRDLSKYAVRINTSNGVKELAKSSRKKAYKIAYDLNKAHGYNFEEVFVDE